MWTIFGLHETNADNLAFLESESNASRCVYQTTVTPLVRKSQAHASSIHISVTKGIKLSYGRMYQEVREA